MPFSLGTDCWNSMQYVGNKTFLKAEENVYNRCGFLSEFFMLLYV